MNPDPIIGRRLLVDGVAHSVLLDDSGEQYVILMWRCRTTCKL